MRKKTPRLPKPFKEYRDQKNYDAEVYLWNYADAEELVVEISLSGRVAGRSIRRFAKWVNKIAECVDRLENRTK